MTVTKTSICNGALLLLGQEGSLVDVDTDTSVYAGDLKAAWDVAVDAAIRMHPWNFAIDFATIGQDDASGAKFGYAKVYTWPSDPWCLRIWRFSRDYHGENPAFRVAGRNIYTSEGSPIYVEYLKRVTDTALFDANFVQLLERVLAEKVAFKITGAMSVQERMADAVAKFRPDATAIDSQESGHEEPDQGEFLEHRL